MRKALYTVLIMLFLNLSACSAGQSGQLSLSENGENGIREKQVYR